MQLLAAMQLRGSGTGPGQATAWLQAAAWLRMGPMGPRGLGPWAHGPQGPWAQPLFDNMFPKCSQMRHGFDIIFKNALKCDMVSTTCSKMLSNATWFRQHVPKCPQMRHGFDNMFQTYQTYQPTNLPTYQPTNLHLYLYLFLVHAQHSCACTTLLCMHWRGQGPRPGPNKKAAAGSGPGGGRFFVGSWPWALAPPVHAQECCACTRVLCMHKK